MKLATCAYAPEWHESAAALEHKLTRWVADAAAEGAELLVFPEYAGVEAVLTDRERANAPAAVWSVWMAEAAERWRDLHLRLAAEFGVWIVAGSLVARADQGLVNRAWLCAPDGVARWQDKLILTPYERREMQLLPGAPLNMFETPLGRVAILICYDSEFPLLARAALEAGAEILLVPSATDFPAGFTRVRQSCRARAIEGQCVVVQAPLLGRLPDCDPAEAGVGCAGVFVPPDYGMPSDGILSQGVLEEEGWIYAELDLSAISAVRSEGQVGNYAHWPEQFGAISSVKTRS